MTSISSTKRLNPYEVVSHLNDNYPIKAEIADYIIHNAIDGRGLLERCANAEKLTNRGMRLGPAIDLAHIVEGIEKGKKCMMMVASLSESQLTHSI